MQEVIVKLVLSWLSSDSGVKCDYAPNSTVSNHHPFIEMVIMMESACAKWNAIMQEEWTCHNGVWRRIVGGTDYIQWMRYRGHVATAVQNFKQILRIDKQRRPMCDEIGRRFDYDAPQIKLGRGNGGVYTTIGQLATAMQSAQAMLGGSYELSFAWKSEGGVDFGNGDIIRFADCGEYHGPCHGERPEDVLRDQSVCDIKVKMATPDWSSKKN